MENNPVNELSSTFMVKNPSLALLHTEADRIQAYMDIPASVVDGPAMADRLCTLDVYMSRLSDMMVRAKAMKDSAKYRFIQENETALNKLTATVSNRQIDTFLHEYSITYSRLDSMYHTMEHITRDLVTQISYLKQQMNAFGA